MKTEYATDVLIIGGGPAGMLSAIYLDLLGISSIVLERQFDLSQHPKAHELSARSIEILGQLGFTINELKKEAADHRDASRILFGHTINEPIGEIDLRKGGNDEKYKAHLASPLPYLNLSQTALENIMRQKLKTCKKSKLLIGHQWESMKEQSSGVMSTVLDRQVNKQLSIYSKYVICADGAGSRSRKALGIEMLGEEKIDDFISVYFELNLRNYLKKTAKLFWIMNPAAPGTFIAHHIEKRWVYHFPIFTPYEKKEQFTKEVLKQRILTALGNKDIPVEIKSISFWRMTSQIATTFRKGRAFLVGDAAHRFPPTGGLGMNSGIGDVQNLCWKLAWVLENKAEERLLDTYEMERKPVIETNSKESLRNYFKIWEVPKAMGLNPKAMKWQAILLNSSLVKLFPKNWVEALLQKIYRKLSRKIVAIPDHPELHQKVKLTIKDQTEHFDRIGLDLGYVYPKGAIIFNPSAKIPEQTVSEYQPSIAPGVRFPHFWVFDQGKKISSHQWLQADKFTLLCNDKGEAWWLKQAGKLPKAIHSGIQLINVTSILNQQAETALEKTFYPIKDVPLLLIRPDGQIAWRPENLEVDLAAVFNQLSSSRN
jgi:2,4-dichlorophenol 6-monooxygenase